MAHLGMWTLEKLLGDGITQVHTTSSLLQKFGIENEMLIERILVLVG